MKKILSLDGGGIRGIIPALVLSEMEKQTGKAIADSFDLIAGTSTGGILALGLSKQKDGKIQYSANDLANLYFDKGKDIFSRSFWKGVSSVAGITDEKYSQEGIESVLKSYFEEDKISNSKTNTLISSYDIENREPLFFKSWEDEWKDIPIRLISRATSAAPTYFEPAYFDINGTKRALIDGGVFINNPAMSAYVEATKLFPEETDFMVVSIGTGELIRKIPYQEAKNWGKIEWLSPLLSCMFDGVSDAVNYQLNELLDDKYFRFQTRLTTASDDMDIVTASNFDALRKEAKILIKNHKTKITELCRLL